MSSDMLTIDQIISAFRTQLEKVAVNGKIKLTTRNQFDVVGKKTWDMLDIMLADSFEQEQKKEEPKAPKIEEQKQEKKIDYKKIFEKKVQYYEEETDGDSGEEEESDGCDDCDNEDDSSDNDDCDNEDDSSDNESDKELDMNKEEEKALDWLFIEWDVYDKDIEGKMDIDKLQGLLSSKVKSIAKKLKVNLFADKKYLIVKFNIGKKEQEEKVDIKKFTKRYEKKGNMIHNFILNKM